MLDWSMDVKEALEVAEQLLNRPLKQLEILIFEESWKGREGKKYREIAEIYPCTMGHVNDAASNLWKLISQALGKKVFKSNFRRELEKRSRSHSAAIPQPQESAQKETVSKNPDFVGREDAIANFTSENELDELVRKVRSHFNKEIQKQCERLRTFDLFTPSSVNLDAIYIHAYLNESKRFNSAQAHQERQQWDEAVLRNPKLIVLGKPGAGKTTLLQYIAVHCDEGEIQPKSVPVFISLQNLAENAKRKGEFSLIGYIEKKYCRHYISQPEIETLLSEGKFLFLLDGLDEVPEEYHCEVVIEIFNLCEEYEKNRFIITCRKESHVYSNKRFAHFNFFEIADFDETQVEDFTRRWFSEIAVIPRSKRTIKADKLINELRSSENPRICELASIPLLLHLMCLLVQAEGTLPSKRADLYDKAIDLLLTGWNSFNHRIQWDICDRDLALLRKTLSQIAARTFELGDAYFEERQIQDILTNCPRTLSEIRVQYGLLVKRGWQTSTYTFSHQTFQEYLTAEAFVNSNPPELEKLVNHITDQRWREVFLLAVGMLTNADCLLQLMKPQIDALVAEDEKLQKFLTWLNLKAVSVNAPFKLAAVRAFYFDVALSLHAASPNAFVELFRECFTSDLAISLDLEFAGDACNHGDISLDFELAHALGDAPTSTKYRELGFESELKYLLQELEDRLPGEYICRLPGEEYQSWWESSIQPLAEQLRVVMIDYRNIGHDWQFRDEQKKVLMQYYNANKLLVECLNSDCYVSREVRSQIEDELLLPIAEIEARRRLRE